MGFLGQPEKEKNMANGAKATPRAAWRMGLAGVVLGAALTAGCGGGSQPDPSPEEKPAPVKAAKEPAAPAAPNKAAPPKLDPFLHQSFTEATLADPPDGQALPDQTMTGKSVGKLYTEVVRIWDTIRFTTPAGKKLEHRAVLDTELGEI